METCIIQIKVSPGSKQNKLQGFEGDFLKIKLTAPAFGGQANDRLLGFLSDSLSLPKSGISIIRGERSRYKQVKIVGMGKAELIKTIERKENKNV